MQKTKVLLSVLLFVCSGLCLCVHAQSKFVTTKDKQFIGLDGKPLMLKGINLGNWLVPEGYMFKFKTTNSPRLIGDLFNQLVGENEARRFWKAYRDNYVTRDDIEFIRKSGMNSVRIPFNYRLFVTESEPQRLEGPGYELLDRVVEMCRKEGLFVVLDMHAAPGGQTGDNIDDSWGYPFLFDSDEAQELTVRIWKKLAAHYKNEQSIIGYDLLNEPIPHYLDTAYFNPKLEPVYRKIVSGIREVDRNHVIFLGGAQWDSNFKVFGRPFDDKLAYTFHKYWVDPAQSSVQEYVDFANKYRAPIWMGESGENTDEWVAKFRTLLEQNEVGWCFWPYKKLDAKSCLASVTIPPEWASIVAFADGPRGTFEEIRKNRPSRDKVNKAIAGLLEQVKFKNCRINQGYLNALGLR